MQWHRDEGQSKGARIGAGTKKGGPFGAALFVDRGHGVGAIVLLPSQRQAAKPEEGIAFQAGWAGRHSEACYTPVKP
jgi:hypothetical protein